MTAPDSVEADLWAQVLTDLQGRLAAHVVRPETLAHLSAFTLALLADLGRKNCWTLAEHAGAPTPGAFQHLLARAAWDHDGVAAQLRALVVAHLGAPGGVLVVDETGDIKKGTHTVGVQRQYSGTAGRVENCQVAVHLGYASELGHAMIDRRLYLPKSWTDDPARCSAAGIPATVAFATKPALAADMIDDALDAGVPAMWVAGDEVYGANPMLARRLEARGVGYVLAIATNRRLPINSLASATASRMAADLPASAWQTRSAGAGAHGLREYEWAWVALDPSVAAPKRRRRSKRDGRASDQPSDQSDGDGDGEQGQRSWSLLVRRHVRTREMAYYLCFSPGATTLGQLVKVAGRRWIIEESFQAAKGLAGLDEHQVRTWTAWHRWSLLAMLAHALLAIITALARQ